MYMSATNMSLKCHISHMPKLVFIHLWHKYANIFATYEVAPISDVARITDPFAYRPHISIYISIKKNNKLQLLVTMLLPHMCDQ